MYHYFGERRSNKIKIQYKTTDSKYKPYQATEGAAGYDLTASQDTRLDPHATVLVGTGLFLAIPDGYHGKIFLRSSTGLKTPLRLANGTGIIDSDYRGEILLPLENTSDKPYRVFEGDCLCQIIIEKNIKVEYQKVETLTDTARSTKGFGSTTKKKTKEK